MSDDGPFTDDMIRHMLATRDTQHAIVKYAEGMAQVLAEAGRASRKATGDAPSYAVERWSQLIKERALAILREEEPKTQEERKQRLLERYGKKNADT